MNAKLFTYYHGGNPYISLTENNFLGMILKYEIIQTGENTFHVIEEKKPPKTYAEKKEALRGFAIEWQDNFSSFHYSWGDVADYSAFFEECGRRFGLLKEFRENAIC